MTKSIKRTLSLLVMALLLGASTAQSAMVEVILDDELSVIRVENFEFEGILYNVDFVTDSAIGVYGPNLEFDFHPEQQVGAVHIALNAVLNNNETIPLTAGPDRTEQYFMGAATQILPPVIVLAFGAEVSVDTIGQGVNIEWGPCKDGCVGGVRLFLPDNEATYADFSVVPVPPAVLLFGSGIVAVGMVSRRRKMTA